jgi:hypothetical protein
MSDEQDESQQGAANNRHQSLFSLIPQDKDHGVNTIAAGLSLTDIFLVLLPPGALFLIATDVLGIPVGTPLFAACGALGLGFFLLAHYAPFYLTPRELVRRNVSYYRRRLRMPLIAEQARNVPGISDVLRKYDALEQENQTIFALVEVPLPNLSQHDDVDMVEYAGEIAGKFDTKISKYEDDGFDVTFHLSQYARNADELDVFRNAQTDGSLTEYERQFAKAREEFLVDGDGDELGYLFDEGVMDRSMHIAVPVEVTEGVGLNRVEKAIRGLEIIRLTDAQRVSQARLLEQRVERVESFARSIVGEAHRLDSNEMISRQRAHWKNERGVLDPADVTTDGPVLGPEEVRTATDGGQAADTDSEGVPEETDTEIETESESAVAPAEAETDDEPPTFRDRLVATAKHLYDLLSAHVNETTCNRMYNLYAPAEVDEQKNHVNLENGKEYAASIYVTGWPKQPAPGVLESVATLPDVRYDMSLSLDTTERYEKRDDLQDEQEKIAADSMVSEYFGEEDSSDSDAAAIDKQDLREHMREHRVDVSEATLVITARGRDYEHVRKAVRNLKSECQQSSLPAKEAQKNQLPALHSTAPTARDKFAEDVAVDLDYDLPADAVGCLLAIGGGVRQDPGGNVLGMAKAGPGDSAVFDPLQVNRDHLAAPHKTIGGESGTGKSAGANLNILEDHLRNPGVRTVIIDVGEGFDGPVYAQDAAKIEVGATTINPFEINLPEGTQPSGTLVEDRADLITSMLMAYLRQRAPERAGDLRDTLYSGVMRTFRNFGIVPEDPATVDPSHPDRKSDRAPEFGDFYHGTLDRMANNPEEFAVENISDRKQEKAKDLLEYLQPFDSSAPDAKYGFLDGQSEVDMTAETVLLDAKRYAQSSGPELSMTIRLATGFARNIARSSEDPVRVVVDEAHEVFSDEEDAQRFASLVLEGRSHGLGFDFISQATKHFINGPAGVIADQCRINIWHEVGDLSAALSDVFNLSAEQERLIAGGLARGDNDGIDRSEALVFVNDDEYLIEKKLSDYEKALVDYKEREDGDFAAYMARETGVHELPEEDIAVIDGLDDDPEAVSQLYAADIMTTVDLTTAGAETVAEAADVPQRRALEWIQQAYQGEYIDRDEDTDEDESPAVSGPPTPDQPEAATDGGLALTEIAHVGDDRADELRAKGYESVADVAEADRDALTEVEGVGECRADTIAESASDVLDGNQQATRAVADGGTDDTAETSSEGGGQ